MKVLRAEFMAAGGPSGYGAEVALPRPSEGTVATEATVSGSPATWLLLAVGSLLVSGLFALLLVVGRIPLFSGFFVDPDFFRRCLAVHVNLSLLVWFSAFAAALFAMLPGVRHGFPLAAWVAIGGAGAMALSAFVPGSAPVLSNYIPFIDHPLFIGGLIAFFAGVAAHYLGGMMRRDGPDAAADDIVPRAEAAFRLPSECVPGVLTAAVLFLVALTTFLAAWAATPSDLNPAVYYELVAWGGGHVLQVANVAAMIAVWLLLGASLTGRRLVSRPVAGALFLLLAAPHLASPLLTWQGTATPMYNIGFTRLMQFGIFPVATVFIILCAAGIFRGWRHHAGTTRFWTDFRAVALLLSLVMTVTGFVLGALIRGSTTMIPAHYHASTGAVTVAFMAAMFVVAEWRASPAGAALLRRFAPWQLLLFGGGQLLFALGFAVGGAHGLGRKEYGAEQHLYAAGEYAGIAMMGVGGLVAVFGGILFFVLLGALPFAGRGRSSDPGVAAPRA